MLEKILSWERDLFLWFNGWHWPLLDDAIWLYSNWLVWLPFLLILFVLLIYRQPVKKWLPVVAAVIFLIAICIITSDVLLKPYFARLRPTYHPDFMNDVKYLFGYKGEGIYGFVSGHATFSFAFATFTALLFRYRFYTVTIFTWAMLMVYSRIYLGVHFLTDIFAGSVVGTAIGLGVYSLFRFVVFRYIYRGDKNIYLSFYSKQRKKLITMIQICYPLLLILFSEPIARMIR